MQMSVTILGRAFPVECASADRRRIEDLAADLNARLKGCAGDAELDRRLVLAALALIDEAQATSAALMRARAEIERLTDMIVEAKLEAAAAAPGGDARGRCGIMPV